MLDIILIGVAAVLVVTLFEMVESRRRKDFIITKQACEITRLYNENNALENKAQKMVADYESQC